MKLLKITDSKEKAKIIAVCENREVFLDEEAVTEETFACIKAQTDGLYLGIVEETCTWVGRSDPTLYRSETCRKRYISDSELVKDSDGLCGLAVKLPGSDITLYVPKEDFGREITEKVSCDSTDPSEEVDEYVNLTVMSFVGEDCKVIPDEAFEGFSELSEFTFPETVTAIGRDAFNRCTALTSAVFPKGLLEIGCYAFENCKSLTYIALPEGLQTIKSGAFKGCSGITELVIPKSVTEISFGAFENCTGLRKVTILGKPKLSANAFGGCVELCELLAEIELTQETRKRFFDGCDKL